MRKTQATFKISPQGFLLDTAHLSASEIGGFVRLLCYQWMKGALPDNDEKLARLSGLTDPKELANVREYFTPMSGGTLCNLRLETHRPHSIHTPVNLEGV